MAVTTAQYVPTLSQDQSRGPSPGVWFNCPIADLVESGPSGIGSVGSVMFDDFLEFPDVTAGTLFGENVYGHEIEIAGWDVYIDNSAGSIGTNADITNLPLEGGVLGLLGGATGHAITLAKGTPSYRIISPATNYPFGQKLWFEARIAVSTVTSANLDLFVGLTDAGFTSGSTRPCTSNTGFFSATNALTTGSNSLGCIGFHKRATSNPTDVAFVYNVNSGTPQYPGTTSTLQKMLVNSGYAPFATGTGGSGGLTAMTSTNGAPVANSFVKLGFLFDPTPGCLQGIASSAVTTNQTVGTVYSQRIQIFVNGQRLPWFLTTTDIQASTFPSSYMVPVIAYRSGATSDGIGYCDWIKVAQLSSY